MTKKRKMYFLALFSLSLSLLYTLCTLFPGQCPFAGYRGGIVGIVLSRHAHATNAAATLGVMMATFCPPYHEEDDEADQGDAAKHNGNNT